MLSGFGREIHVAICGDVSRVLMQALSVEFCFSSVLLDINLVAVEFDSG